MTETFGLSPALAPPMANGELLFEAPWQARVFGMARALSEQGLYTWDEFREALIAAIARWESSHRDTGEYAYYDCFVEALETLLVRRGALESDAVSVRHGEIEARPHGHDHHHEH